MDDRYTILKGDCLESMRTMPDQSVQCCVTSPPYWGLRDYGHEGQIGLEQTPEAYVASMVDVFREVRRVLRDDGTLWLNLGDSYANSGLIDNGGHKGLSLASEKSDGVKRNPENKANQNGSIASVQRCIPTGLKPKDLVGIPWRVAFALQADGWYLRQDIIWAKPNPMPESVKDRCTKAHEYIFLLSKSERYFFDSDAIKEPATYAGQQRGGSTNRYEQNKAGMDNKVYDTRNKRSVWTVRPAPYKGAHFATFPIDLIEPCILAGCPVGGTVLDPFGGSGTTAIAALKHNRKAILCELNPEYIKIAHERIPLELTRMKSKGKSIKQIRREMKEPTLFDAIEGTV